MYEQHFGLSDKPFRVVPSPRFLYESDTHDESRARILYGIKEGRGFVVVTGAVGLGKTTVLLSVLDELDDRVRTALVFNPVDTFEQLLRLVCMEFGVEVSGKDEVTLLWELNLFLVECMAEHLTCVLMIDEAQNLSLELLEKVRTLSNLQTESSSLLQIVLIGQPELEDKLDDPRLLQLRQRVGVWHRIDPLNRKESRAYVWHRIRLAGQSVPEGLFGAAACDRVFEISEGIPRVINQLCDTALVIAYGAGESDVRVERVDEAAAELRLLQPRESIPPRESPTTEAPRSEPARGRDANAAPVASDASKRKADSPSRRGLGSWRWVAAVIVLLLLLWGAGQRVGFLPGPLARDAGLDASSWARFARADAETLQSESTDPDDATLESAGKDGALASEAADASTNEGPESPDAAPRRPRLAGYEEVEALRAQGTPVYSAHLASFREIAKARRFAAELLDGQSDWKQPLYVEASDDGWLRVMAGGFGERDVARDWVRELKGPRGLDYAQLERLLVSAEPLWPRDGAR